MKIIIDTDDIVKLNISINEYVQLYLYYHSESGEGFLSLAEIMNLEKKGYIKDNGEFIVLRQKTINLFKSNEIPKKQNEFENFVEKYRELFPAGVKSGGRLVKGDRLGCLSKMKSFATKYPEYTQEEILDATKSYLDGKRRAGWSMTSCADYFIDRDKQSQLASYCEDIRLRGNKKITNGRGQSEDI